MTDVWFAGGLVVDGSGKDPASVDVRVTDNVITSIGKAPAGAETVELDGRLRILHDEGMDLDPVTKVRVAGVQDRMGSALKEDAKAFADPDMAAVVVKDGQIAKDIR